MAKTPQAAMVVLGRIADLRPPRRETAARIAAAALFALGLHLLAFQLMMFDRPEPFEMKENFITIELVTLPPPAQSVKAIETPPEIDEAPLPPAPKPKPQAAPKLNSPPPPASEAPNILASPQKATAEELGDAVPLSALGAEPTPLPSGPSEDDVRIDEGLKSLAADLACLNGFSVDCADIRKEVFEDLQMSETDKVYTKKYAHTGMPVEFYGMSERAIRAKLNVPNAGENGIVIIPGLLALDGNWWDAMHGVNKKCEWKFAGPASSDPFTRSGELSSATRHGAIKDCPDYLPAAREDRNRRNKFIRLNE